MPGHKHGFFRSVENSNLNKLLHFGVWVLACSFIFIDTVANGNHIVMADVVAIVLLPLYDVFVADGEPLWQML